MMIALTIALACVAALLVLAPLAVAVGRWAGSRSLVYGACLVAALVSLAAALAHLTGAAAPATVTLPLGLPWLGSHFRLDCPETGTDLYNVHVASGDSGGLRVWRESVRLSRLAPDSAGQPAGVEVGD